MCRLSSIVVVAMLLFVAGSSGWAQQPNPDSPRYLGLMQLRDFLKTSGDDTLNTFIEQRLADSMIEKHGRENLLKMLEATRTAYSRAEFAGARPIDEFSAELVYEETPAGVPASLGFSVEKDPPHRFAKIDLLETVEQPAPVASDADLAASLEKYLNELVAADEFSGTVLLAKNEKPIFERASGMASKRFNVPNNLDTKINLGSMNKMFTGVAICQLVDQGKLSFDDSIAKHVPDYPNKEIAEAVTIHHLLTHTSGLGSYWNDKYEQNWKTIRTIEDLIPTFADDPLSFEPGDRFQYSNAGPAVLGLIIERVSGMSYYDYVREQIFLPSGMTDTDSYEMDRPVPNLAIGYTRANYDGTRAEGPRRNNLFMHSVKGGPGGGGFSTVRDLLRFSLALQNDKLLKPETKKLMLDGKTQMGPDLYYAYLFGQHGTGVVRSHGHNGGAPGISADFRFYPELGYTVAVLSNYDDAASSVAQKIETLIRQKTAIEHPKLAVNIPKYRLGIAFGRQNDAVVVRQAIEDGPAAKAGLVAGDIINKINGESLGEQWLDLLSEPLATGSTITFEVVRNNETREIDVVPEPLK